jgi:hypothetical protein
VDARRDRSGAPRGQDAQGRPLADGDPDATEEARIKRLIDGLGVNTEGIDTVPEDAAVLDTGFPLVALLRLVCVSGQAMARIADAEVRLFHLCVHEPLMRSGTTHVEIAEQMHAMSCQVLALTADRRVREYGRDINIASRVAARSAGGEVLVARPRGEESG